MNTISDWTISIRKKADLVNKVMIESLKGQPCETITPD